MFRKTFLVTIFALLMLSSFAFAIEQGGSLAGTVVDESGVGLPGVEVSVSGPSLMGTRTTITNPNGDFRIPQLNVGIKYAVVFTLKGFKTVDRKDIRIELGKETRLPIIMKFGEITEKVVVTGEVPVVDTKSSTNQVNISREVVETLANDRQYQSIMEMMPGAIPGNNPSMLGASDTDNMYQFDGMESTDPLTKTWSTAQNFDNFEEMQVVTQGASAEYGRGTGAVINVVTKSGSNQIHGTARVNFSKADWNADPKDGNISFDDPTHYLNETRPAINLGGPILKDRIWFFGSYERRNKWKPATWYNTVEESLAQTPSGHGRGYYKGHYASAKLTFRLGTFSMMGMWSEDPIVMPEMNKYSNSINTALDVVEKTQGGWNANGEITTTLGSNTFIIGRVSIQRGKLNNISKVQEGIRYESQTGFVWGAGAYDYRSKRDANQFQINVNQFMDSSFGYHDIKFGAELYQMNLDKPINPYYPGGVRILLSYSGLGRYKLIYDDAIKNAKESGNIITFFLQDKWEVTKGLTLNLGLRTEQTSLKNDIKEEVLKFKFDQQLAPRLGVAYSFGKNKVSFNFGRFYDIEGWYIVDNFQPDKFQQMYHLYRGPAFGFKDWTFYRNVWVTPPAGGATKDANLKAQFMDEYALNFERVLSKKLAASVSYTHRAWKDKIDDYDDYGIQEWHFANEKNWTDLAQNIKWGRTFRKYDAVIFTLKKNLGDDKFQFLASYTWAKLKGFDGSDTATVYGDDPYKMYNMCGYLANDVRHMFKFYGSVIAPFDIVVGLNFYWFSGQPYTNSVELLYEDGGKTAFDGSYYTYLLDPRGTSGRFPSEWRMDLRVEKKFKVANLFTVSGYIDIFNLLNQQNEIARDSNMGNAKLDKDGNIIITSANPNYGKYTAWYAPMSFFVGAKIEW